jgi:PAS domain S-box-containing protein
MTRSLFALLARLAALRGLPGSGYLAGIALFAVALWGRFALAPFLPPTGFPFLTFFPAVILTTLLGGLGPGLLVSALSTAAAKFFFIPTLRSFMPATSADLIALTFFAAVILVDCAVIHIMNTSLRRVREERARSAGLAQEQQALAARLRLALEAGRMGAWSWDLDGDRLEWDARQHELHGVDPAAGPVLLETAMARVHPEDRPGLQAAIARAIEAGNGTYQAEFRVRLPDGSLRWIAGYGHAVPDATGRAVRLAGLNFDVTERREATEALARLNEDLERRVEAEVQAREAAQARAAHAERMQALGQLAGGIAHDFNNVLQGVQGGARVIERRADDPTSTRRFARMILDAAERGATITRRLLAFARRDALHAEPVAPATLLGELRDVLAPTLGSPIAVRLELAAALPPLLADKGQLETVLVNLATNARDAMPDGGTLTLAAVAEEVAAGTAHPAGLRPGRYIRLLATDSGMGMDAATLARVGEPFFTTKPKGQGTGLGLSMAKGFAEQSGGGLAIASAPGRGTTVSLWLPVAAAAAAGGPAGAAAGGVGAVRRVLLVDDERLVRETLAAELQDAGCAVLAAGTGRRRWTCWSGARRWTRWCRTCRCRG